MTRTIQSLLLTAAIAFGQTGVSVNGLAGGSDVQAGLPVIVSVTSVNVEHPRPESLEAVGPDGVKAVLTLRPSAGESQDMGPRLKALTSVWTVSPESSAELAPGRYAVQLDATLEVAFRIVAASGASESAGEQSARMLLHSAYRELAGDKDQSAQIAGELLTAQPESIAARLRLSDLLADRKEYAEALRLLDEAEMTFRRSSTYKQGQPPVLIRSRQSRILDAITERN